MRVMRLRDRNNSLKIVAETPGKDDVDAYRKALDNLRDALNIAHPPEKD